MTKKYTEKEMVERGSCMYELYVSCSLCPWRGNNVSKAQYLTTECFTENVKAYKERLSELNSDIS